MKNVVFALMLVIGFASLSYAGNCSNGTCAAPSRRVVTVTKNVVRETVRLPRRVLGSCVNGSCSRTVTRVR